MPETRIGEARITRTPLGGSADAAIEEATHHGLRIIQGASTHATQSVGTQGGGVQLDNQGGRYNSWKSPDDLKVEARLAGSGQDYVSLMDGFIAECEYVPGTDRPVLGVQVQGWLTTLDLVQIPTETTYVSTAWTTIADSLITLCLGAGYARSITADASVASRMTFLQGISLRQALEMVRSGLNGGTDKWEQDVVKVAGVKTYRLYKRSTTVQRTIRRKDCYPDGTRRTKGSIIDVVNKATVIGATISKSVQDKTTLTHTAYRRLDASTKRLAHYFVAPDTPLYGVSFYADRSKVADPPTLTGTIARASTNLDFLTRGYAYKRSSLIISNQVDTPGNLVDDDTNAAATYTGPAVDATYREVATWDFGTAIGISSAMIAARTTPNGVAEVSVKLQSSPDNSTWTDRAGPLPINKGSVGTGPAGAGDFLYPTFASVSARYWRLVIAKTIAGTITNVIFYEVDFYPWKNEASTPTFPGGILRRGLSNGSGDTDVATTGAVQTELARFDLITAQAIAKLEFTHTESSASSLLNIRLQKSDDGSSWTDLAVLPSTTSLVTDTAFVEEPDFRYFRVLVDDARTGGSASITTNGRVLAVYVHGQLPYPGTTPPTLVPLIGDAMKGSSQSWDVSSLVTTPGIVEQRTYPAPRLALMVGRTYALILQVSGGSTTSYWDISYGTESGMDPDDASSTDSGATYTAIAADAVIRSRLEFNNSALVGTASDAGSQATYASFVPNGVLQASYVDEALQTQAAVDAEAAALVNRKKDLQERIVVCIPGDPTLNVGSRVTLAQDLAELLGLTAAFDSDVVEVEHNLGRADDGYKTYLTLNEHEDDPLQGQQTVVSGVNVRRI